MFPDDMPLNRFDSTSGPVNSTAFIWEIHPNGLVRRYVCRRQEDGTIYNSRLYRVVRGADFCMNCLAPCVTLNVTPEWNLFRCVGCGLEFRISKN